MPINTILKRYDGNNWTPIYMKTSANMVELSNGNNVEECLAPLGGATTAQTALDALGAGVRPNLLDNPFFAVNQRGQTSYATNSYAVDRWYLIANTETLMTVQADGVVLTASSQYGSYLHQIIPPEEVARLRGETVCFSALCGQNDNDAWYANIYVNDQWRDALALTPNTVTAKAFTVPEDAQRMHLSFGSGAAGSCKLRASKVELGNTQTLGYQDEDGAWHLLPQPESDYATQLARCQRYQFEAFDRTISGQGYLAQVKANSSTAAYGVLPTPVTMREGGIPSLVTDCSSDNPYNAFGIYSTGYSNGEGAITEMSVFGKMENGVIIRATGSDFVAGNDYQIWVENQSTSRFLLDLNL